MVGVLCGYCVSIVWSLCD